MFMASDGAGSAQFGGQGASLVCRVLVNCAREHFRSRGDLPSDAAVASWLDDLRDRIVAAANGRGALMRDFAATLVCALITEESALVLHIGDGAVVARQAGAWEAVSWPETGEYASTTYFVTDDEGPRIRLTRLAAAPEAVAVFTDGIERLVLDLSARTAHAPFFERMIRPVESSNVDGHHAKLSAALGAYLDSDAVCERTDDDKTLLLAVRR
jgi:hypothetical protein